MAAINDLSVKMQHGKLNVRVAAVITSGSKVLLELGYNNQFYVLPGGRVKFGESAEDAVVREVEEEIGESIKVVRCLYVHQNFFPWNVHIDCHELGFYFLAEASESLASKQEFTNKDGQSTFRWMELSQVKNVDFFPVCIKEEIENLPQHTKLITEHYDVENECSWVVQDVDPSTAKKYQNVTASFNLVPVKRGGELWDLYDVNRRPLGKVMERGGLQPPNTYHLVAHVCIFNRQGKMLCQHRQPFKQGWSNMWDLSVGGNVLSGENSQQGARREAMEEIGVTLPYDLVPSLTVHFEGGLDDYYCLNMDVDAEDCSVQEEEVSEVAYFSLDEIKLLIDEGKFVPYDKNLVAALFYLRNRRDAISYDDTTVRRSK